MSLENAKSDSKSGSLRQREQTIGSSPVTTGRATGAAAESDERVQELIADLQRTRADFENYRKQMDAQKAQAVEYAKYETVKKVLPLLDDIDRAIASTPELKPLEKSLEKTLNELKLEKISSKQDEDFNPDLHDAVMMENTEGDKQVISETLRAGYKYGGAVIRPAMVKVKNV